MFFIIEITKKNGKGYFLKISATVILNPLITGTYTHLL